MAWTVDAERITDLVSLLRRARPDFPFPSQEVSDEVVRALARRFCGGLEDLDDAAREVSYIIDLIGLALEQARDQFGNAGSAFVRIARELETGNIDLSIMLARDTIGPALLSDPIPVSLILFAVRLEMLSGDAVSVAKRLHGLAASLRRPPAVEFALLRDFVEALCSEASKFGVRFPSTVAVEMGKMARLVSVQDDASAETLMQLGDLLARSAAIDLRPESVEEGIQDLRQALVYWERTHNWIEAARAHNRIADFLQAKAIVRHDVVDLSQAAEEYRDALSMIDREERPLEWAAVQNSLGCVLGAMARACGRSDFAESAASAFRLALKARAAFGRSADWTSTQLNLGTALADAAWAKGDVRGLREASSHLRSVIESAKKDLSADVKALAKSKRAAIQAEIKRLQRLSVN